MRPYTHRSLSRRRHSMSRASGGYATVFYFVSTWDTTKTSAGSSTSTQVKLPLESGGTYNFEVDWGDASSDTITAWNQAEVTHTYGAGGIYEITITGRCDGWRFNNTGDRLKISDISDWGNLNLGNNNGYFYGCGNLNVSATNSPIFSTNLSNAFRSCAKLTGIGTWDVSAVTNMSTMFGGCFLYNQNISGWDVSAVTDMSLMLSACTVFNQPIGVWDVGNVLNMDRMFDTCYAFNQTLADWDVSLVQNMHGVFGFSGFNQPINAWDVSSVTDMSNMFDNNYYFNQTLVDWDVSSVTTMASMFGNTPFNQDISGWDVSAVTNMSSMFFFNTAFNQDLSSWITSLVTNMSSMFFVCISFDADLGGWDVTALTNATNMFSGATLSTANYDSLLIGWESQAVNNTVTLNGGSSTYSAGAAATARAALIADHSWSITDGGPA